ncbi:MAG: hypothetical protein MRJ96_01270 [Nitrospirales bacterium]|nr:hypothetical protein [Nitrospira sp.]MDR4500073.1 hypothetical protein [Nitrospirales bacterium]
MVTHAPHTTATLLASESSNVGSDQQHGSTDRERHSPGNSTKCDWTSPWPAYSSNPFSIPTSLPPLSGRGGIIVNFFTDDCLLDYAISQKDGKYGSGVGRIAVYDHDGHEVWIEENIDLRINGNAEHHGLPGWSGPGLSSGDVDGDGKIELVHLDTDNHVVIRDGQTGAVKKTFSIGYPAGSNPLERMKQFLSSYGLTKERHWGMVQVVNLRGQGLQDAILQSDHLPFNQLAAIRLDTGALLWTYEGYVGQKHGGFRTADIDLDGRDEVIGVTILDDDGKKLNTWEYPVTIDTIDAPHIDAVHAYDIDPSIPGLEVLLLEEHWGKSKPANHTTLVNADKVIWRANREYIEPQNSAIGEFDLSAPGLEIWSRSRFDKAQLPWIYNAQGEVIAQYALNDMKPEDWSDSGIEFINAIHWDGNGLQHIAAKERHTEGKVAILNPMTGEFLKVWDETAAHLLVADVAGDAREEIIVFNNKTKEIRIYWNEKPGSGDTQRLWLHNHYQRAKDNYNYYSP